MRIEKISFHEQLVFFVFPEEQADLAQAISNLHLNDSYPVIVLIGGDIQAQQEVATHTAIESLAKIAEDLQSLVICGGTDMGVMAEIGQIHRQNAYHFPLVGITLDALVTLPDGPRSKNFFGWGKKRWPLAPNYSHFILVPGSEFGDESPWIDEAASILSKNHRSVTVLINGGNVSRKDVQFSIERGRPVIAISGTGRLANELANELASETNRDSLISVVPAMAEARLNDVIRTVLVHAEEPNPSLDGHNLAQDDTAPAHNENSPTILSRREESKPINANKSELQIPESFIK